MGLLVGAGTPKRQVDQQVTVFLVAFEANLPALVILIAVTNQQFAEGDWLGIATEPDFVLRETVATQARYRVIPPPYGCCAPRQLLISILPRKRAAIVPGSAIAVGQRWCLVRAGAASLRRCQLLSVGSAGSNRMAGVPRDPRLDFFRGSALVLIFIDHIPSNLFSYFTLHAIAFCDSAEVFIFISGYAAGLVYGGDLQRNGILYCTVRVWRRVWQLYVTHIFLFVVFTATVSYTVSTFNNPMYSEEMQVGHFLVEPHVAIIKALMLEFQPTFLDILPLYIVLLATFSLVLMLLRRNLLFVLVPSLLVYSAVQRFQGLELHTYPGDQTWYFNPFAWQFLFLIGAAFGHAQFARRDLLPASNALVFAAAAFAGAAAAINASWTLHWFYDPFPALLAKQLIPISKTDLAPLRLINALALALLVSHWLRPDNRLLQSRLARPLILCGRNSLDIFCISVMLSLVGHLILVEVNDRVLTQILVIFAGFAVMVLAAAVLSYFKSVIAGPRRRAAVDVLQGKPSE